MFNFMQVKPIGVVDRNGLEPLSKLNMSLKNKRIIRTNTPNQINVIVEKTTEIIPIMLKLLTS